MAQTFSHALLEEVNRLISQELEIEVKILALGNVADYALYRERVGRIFAYDRVVNELFATAESNLEKR